MLEPLQYLASMGPAQLVVIQAGVFDRPSLSAAWRPAEAAAARMRFEDAVAAIRAQSGHYAKILGQWRDSDFRAPVDKWNTMNLWAGMDAPA